MNLHFQKDEKILLKLHKHWFILLTDNISTIFSAILPTIIFFIIYHTKIVPINFVVTPSVLIFMFSLWFLIVWISAAAIWTNYYLDIWIVTDKRIINIDQIGLFNREITTTRMERVQDATVRYRGIIPTLLNFGSLRIQTASVDASDTMIQGIPNPSAVRNTILMQVDLYTERHTQEHSNKDPNICHDTHEE